ncbi:MAG: cytochrome b [Spirulina sp. SIO3F2]|nr:cytochrome b [Spirulina sp. SIO3F2]
MTAPSPPKPRRNSAFQRLMSIHWWMAGLYPVLFIGGWIMEELQRDNPVRSPLYSFHKSLGILTLMLLSWRIVTLLQVWLRKYVKRHPKFTLPWLRHVVLHTVIYGFMLAVPLTGIFLSNSFKAQNVRFFGLVLPDLFPENKAVLGFASDLHGLCASLFLAVVILHLIDQRKVVRALWRRFRNWLGKRQIGAS